MTTIRSYRGDLWTPYDPRLIMNDKKGGRKVLTAIKDLLSRCTHFRFFVAFVNQEGVISLINQLRALEDRGIRGEILVSQYLNFTEPLALRSLLQFKNLDVRINTDDSMHTKGYFFYESDSASVLIGSSNWTASALSSNLELNVLLEAEEGGDFLNEVDALFEKYFNSASKVDETFIENYERGRHIRRAPSPDVQNNLELVSFQASQTFDTPLQPNRMQVEALAKLGELRARGETKGLIVSATGTGKTLLSAFDALSVDASRLLFVVHRETIAQSALKDFETIFGDSRTYGVFGGGSKETGADFIFSTVQTLSKESNLQKFDPTHFDYVIVDESHRAGAHSYKVFLDYFKPGFLLGMTATPERTDGQDIYSLFDHNLAYEIRLQRALEENMLCPFHYFGISDLILDGVSIDDHTDFRNLVSDQRVEHIIRALELYGCDDGVVRGLIFCSRVEECEELAQKFKVLGKRCISLSGKDSIEFREEAIRRLEADPSDSLKLDYIFSVDIFNEGVDIPSVNQIVMLRPTQSAIIFVQQLGRGLRRLQNKEKYLTVIDFIGNYNQNFLIPVALFGDQTLEKDKLRRLMVGGNDLVPGQSTVNFDEIAKQRVFDAVNQANLNTLKELKADYGAMKAKVGRVPTMLDFIEQNGRDPYSFAKHKKSFYGFSYFVEPQGTLPELEDNLQKALAALSRYVLNGKYIEEIEIVERLLSDGRADLDQLAGSLDWLSSDKQVKPRLRAAVTNLNLEFRREQVKKDGKTSLVKINESIGTNLVNLESGAVLIHKDLEMMWTDEFRRQLSDLCGAARSVFERNFDIDLYENGLVRYRKYERGDVFRALLWEENPVAQNVGGYLISPDRSNCPIFVTHDKSEEISATTKYEDAFISPSRLEWYSKSKRTLESPEIEYLRNISPDQRLPLFVKKSDDEGISFYYLGDVRPEEKSFLQETMASPDNKPVSVVKMNLELEHSVPESLYNYLVT